MIRRKVNHGDTASPGIEEEVQEEGQGKEAKRKRRHSTRKRTFQVEGKASRQGEQGEVGQVGQQVTPLDDARRMLREVHAETDKIMVGLSGGKDSLVTLDLCVSEFGPENVRAYFMYLVKGLRCVETVIRWCENRYKIKVDYFPHWSLGLAYKYATYMPHRHGADEWRDMRQVDVEMVARKKSGVDWLAYGHRMTDSIERVGMLTKISGLDQTGRRAYPLWRWNEASVLAYLRMRKIPLPAKISILKRSMSGVSFEEDTLLAIRERFPDDFAKIVEVFPYVGAKLARYEFQKKSWKQKTYFDKFKTPLRGR